MSDKGKILIVDDEAIVRDSLTVWLEDEGFKIFTAENGQKALEFLSKHEVDVGVFDIKMPVMDGLVLLRKVIEFKESFPIVMMTAHATVESAVECMRQGAYDYVIKPFPPEKLTKLLENIITHRRLAREHRQLQEEYATAQLQLERNEKLMNFGKFAIQVAGDLENFLIQFQSETDKIKQCLCHEPKCGAAARCFVELEGEAKRIRKSATGVAAIVQALEPVTNDVSLNTVIESALETAVRHSEVAKANIELHLAADLPNVEGRFWSFVQAFKNLIMNAADAIREKGEIIISTSLTSDGMVCGQVADTGCGIPENDLAKLFDPFYTGWERKEGIGLGLVVTRGIVQRFGGRIDVESEIGKGSTFKLMLPSAKASN